VGGCWNACESPTRFVLRTAVPPIGDAEGRRVQDLRRIGKRIVVALEGERFLVLHLMIAGRLRWLERKEKPPGRITLATFEFDAGTLAFTEAGTKRRASLHFVADPAVLAGFDAGGLEIDEADLSAFADRLKRENHTLKRALTDPRLFAGIGNAYSDEILHRARLSPIAHTAKLDAAEVERLFAGDPGRAARMGRAVARAGRRRLSREGHRFPARDGGARPLWQAVSGLRRTGAANRLRGERVQLLRALPDERRRARR
jgi:formamidopyrimidine-DNA glycosylase